MTDMFGVCMTKKQVFALDVVANNLTDGFQENLFVIYAWEGHICLHIVEKRICTGYFTFWISLSLILSLSLNSD